MIDLIKTKIGIIKIRYRNEKIYSVKFVDDPDPDEVFFGASSSSQPKGVFVGGLTASSSQPKGVTVNSRLAIKINKFLKKGTHNFGFKVKGTKFQIKVWKQIMKIPFGETKTYSEIAELIGKPKAIRAVANACGQNKLALFIPCHRVVGKNGYGGYKWGIDKKKFLLKLEAKRKKLISNLTWKV